MSNVASKDLCEELYKVSGWGGVGRHYPSEREREDGMTEQSAGDKGFAIYDAGYLLRKLPPEIKLDGLHYVGDHKVNDFYLEMEAPSGDSGKWAFFYSNGGESYCYSKESLADTPEDALCRLSLELFKQGVLK